MGEIKNITDFRAIRKEMDTKEFCALYGIPEEGIYVKTVISYGPYFIEPLENGEYMVNFSNDSFKSNLLAEVEEYFWNGFVKDELAL